MCASLIALLLMVAPVWAQESDLSITKTLQQQTTLTNGNELLQYSIEVCNAGPSDAIGQYTVTDVVENLITGGPATCGVTVSYQNLPPGSSTSGNQATITEDLQAGMCQNFFAVVELDASCMLAALQNRITITNWQPYEDPDVSNNEDTGQVLPVELGRFTAEADGRAALLEWTTVSETNNAGFHVQHRAPGAAWTAVGFVRGAGTTDAPKAYRFRTDPLAAGQHQFRLQQVDHDGSTALSDPVPLRIALDRPFALALDGPNPFRTATAFALTVQHPQTVHAGLYDVLGRRVATLFADVVTPGAPQAIRVSAGSLAPGSYFLRITGERFSDTRRIVVAR